MTAAGFNTAIVASAALQRSRVSFIGLSASQLHTIVGDIANYHEAQVGCL